MNQNEAALHITSSIYSFEFLPSSESFKASNITLFEVHGSKTSPKSLTKMFWCLDCWICNGSQPFCNANGELKALLGSWLLFNFWSHFAFLCPIFQCVSSRQQSRTSFFSPRNISLSKECDTLKPWALCTHWLQRKK